MIFQIPFTVKTKHKVSRSKSNRRYITYVKERVKLKSEVKTKIIRYSMDMNVDI